MSRRGNANSSNGGGAVVSIMAGHTGVGPPSHPAEQNPEHRAFLIRSLERNDADLAALMELNSGLESVKNAIIRTCGELTLLNLGQGLVTLDPEGEALQGSEDVLPDEGQELCVDFLLRMKLRRKLLNRLARRLNRVAHAMDGADVEPPGPPRYGDLRLHVDPHEVRAFAELSARQEQAVRSIALQREKQSVQSSHPRKPSRDGDGEDDETEPTNPVSSEPMETDQPEQIPEPIGSDGNPASKIKDETGESLSPPPFDSPDYEALRSYDDAYEKRVVDAPKTGTFFKYTVLDRPTEEDYAKIRFGAGIGATHRSMSAKDKENEFLRWQGSLLSRIPEQPTFRDVGMEHRVFLLQDRRRKALQEEEERKARAQKTASDTGDAMAIAGSDAEGAPGDETLPTPADGETSKDVHGDDDSSQDESEARMGDDKEKEDSKPSKQEDEQEAPVNRNVKAVSLAAVPSFYEQDLKRIKLIHLDLMSTNMHDHARKRLEEVTIAYNTALRRSSELNSRREQLELNLQKVLYQARTTMDNRRSESAVDVWAKGKLQYEDKQLNELLPSRWGSNPTGTVVTQQYGRRSDAISQHVAHCLADIVDSVELMALDQIPKMQLYPYPRPAAETSQADVLRKLEAQLREDLTVVTSGLRRSEEERNRAWKKMLKTKAEFDLPHHSSSLPSYTAASSRAKVPLSMSNYHQVPLPTLRTSMAESVPQEVATSRPAVASYIPQRSHVTPSVRESSESRYSAARVKERIASDGTVAPVSEPKRSKDGLFLRPAGRTRKGMQWDALRGIWVPAANSTDE